MASRDNTGERKKEFCDLLYFLPAGRASAGFFRKEGEKMLKQEGISYPELGHIYPGDYYEAIPFEDYIRPQQIPESSRIFDIRDFGAEPGGMLSTEPICRACEACRDAGG